MASISSREMLARVLYGAGMVRVVVVMGGEGRGDGMTGAGAVNKGIFGGIGGGTSDLLRRESCGMVRVSCLLEYGTALGTGRGAAGREAGMVVVNGQLNTEASTGTSGDNGSGASAAVMVADVLGGEAVFQVEDVVTGPIKSPWLPKTDALDGLSGSLGGV
jgi:hypothetical protein